MITRIKWFERKFNFDFPVGLFPCILERLRGTPARLEEITSSIEKEFLIRKNYDSWSIQEQIGHLLDLDELHSGRLEDFKNRLKILRPADLTNAKTYSADHNRASLNDILRDFRKERFKFVQSLEMINEDEASIVAEHPRLKQPMRLIDMIFFVAEHDDHHIAGITETIKKFRN